MKRIAFVSAEFRPLAKIGGLADVAEELPRSLLELGLDVRMFFPRYSHIDLDEIQAAHERTVLVQRGEQTIEAQFYTAQVGGIPVHLVDGPALQQAPEVYPGQPLEGERFVFFTVAVVNYFTASGWIPDVLHANDWHTAASVPYLKMILGKGGDAAGLQNTGTLLTVHNLPYMGSGSEPAIRGYCIPAVDRDSLPDWAQEIPLPMGIALADRVNTVSPTYALEIQTKEYGSGLDGLLRLRADVLSGILNGIDPASWDPAASSDLAVNFSRETIEKRVEGKTALQQELGLPVNAGVPLLGMVTRLDTQKGVDIALDALGGMVDSDWQCVLLGTGNHHLESRCKDFEALLPDRVRAVLKYDGKLANRIYASSDMILVPSRYEPCGLAQTIAMRYGAIPVVRATGGLKDSVPQYSEDGEGFGFLFEELSPEAFRMALGKALDAYHKPELWRSLQLRAMAADNSWKHAAMQYRELYLQIISEKARH